MLAWKDRFPGASFDRSDRLAAGKFNLVLDGKGARFELFPGPELSGTPIIQRPVD